MQNENTHDASELEFVSEETVEEDVMRDTEDADMPESLCETEEIAEKEESLPPAPLTKKEKLRSFLKKYWYLLVCFGIPAGIMLLIHFGLKVYPFGESSVLVLDLNAQYVYYFEALRDIISGEGSFLYSFGRTLGGEFMGIFAYYLASPLSFIVALFPKEMITEALLTMIALKTGLCGLTFGIYIHKTRKRNPIATVVFSTLYALTAYGVVYQHNTMWIDNVILLPLILLGIEEMIRHGKYKLFVITLSMAVLSNFYIGYMTCLFVAVYFFYAYFSRTPEERNPLGVKHHFAKSFGRIALFSVIVIAISAIILLPAYYSLSFGKTTFSTPKYTMDSKFDLLDALSMMFFGSYDTVRPEGLPLLYSGMLTFMLLPLYFFAPHVKTREKLASGALIGFFFFSFNGSLLDLVWHGFQRPNWLNYRYSFMLCFMMILFAYKAFEKIREIGYRYCIASVGVISMILIILQKMEYANIRDFATVWASLIFLGVYLCILRASSMPQKETRKTAALVLAIVVALEVFCAGYLNLKFLDADVIISSRTKYREFVDRVDPVAERIEENDDSFYRTEKLFYKKVNDNLALGMRGVSHSTSTLHADVIKMFNRLGYASKSHWTKYIGSTPVTDAIISMKYIIAEKDDTVSPLYEPFFTHEDDLTVYKNPYSLSLAFGVSDALREFDLYSEDYRNPFQRMNGLLTAMTAAESTVDAFVPVDDVELSTSNCKVSLVSGHKKYALDGASTGKVTFTFTAPKDGLIYYFFPSDYPREVDVYVNNLADGTFYGNESFAIGVIGPVKQGEKIMMDLSLKKEEVYLATNTPYFYTLDEATFKDAYAALSASQLQIDSFTDDSFYGSIRAAEGQTLVFTSIPYDKGWVVKVDGKETPITEVLGALMAFSVPDAGEHTVSLEYKPACVKHGAILSITGVTAFAGICVGEWIIKKNKKKKGILVE